MFFSCSQTSKFQKINDASNMESATAIRKVIISNALAKLTKSLITKPILRITAFNIHLYSGRVCNTIMPNKLQNNVQSSVARITTVEYNFSL